VSSEALLWHNIVETDVSLQNTARGDSFGAKFFFLGGGGYDIKNGDT
jgi:hypothetical protein